MNPEGNEMSSLVGRIGAVVLVTLVAGSSITLHAGQSQTVRQGVYSEAQATRGQSIYKERCSSCHGDALAGRMGPPLTGDTFLAVWSKEPLSELAGKIRNTMPQTDPGTLTWQQTAELLAYM